MMHTPKALLTAAALHLCPEAGVSQELPASYTWGLSQRAIATTSPTLTIPARLSGHGLPDLCLVDGGSLFLITAPGIHESDGPLPVSPDGMVVAASALVDYPVAGVDGLVLATDAGLFTWSYVDDVPSQVALGYSDGEDGICAATVLGSQHAFVALGAGSKRATTYCYDGSSWTPQFQWMLSDRAFDIACGDWTGDGNDELAVCDSQGLHVLELSTGALLYDYPQPASRGRVISLPWGDDATAGFGARFAWAAPVSATEDQIVAIGPPGQGSTQPMISVCGIGGRSAAGLSGTLLDLNDYPDVVVSSRESNETLLLFDMAVYGGVGYQYQLGATWIVPYASSAPAVLTCNGSAADFNGDGTVDLMQPLGPQQELASVPGIDFSFGAPPPEDFGGGLIHQGGLLEPGPNTNEWELRLLIDTDEFPVSANALDVVAWEVDWANSQTPHLDASSVQRSITTVAQVGVGLQQISVPNLVLKGEQLGVSEVGEPLPTPAGSYALLVRPVVRQPATGRVIHAFSGAIGLASWDSELIENSMNLPNSQGAVVIGNTDFVSQAAQGGLLITFVYRPCAPPANPPQSVFIPSAP